MGPKGQKALGFGHRDTLMGLARSVPLGCRDKMGHVRGQFEAEPLYEVGLLWRVQCIDDEFRWH
jgi:hypothetical protein